ncbi:hypothetical protein PVIIG_06559 [Plasmodium vivax India VII]|uniref:Uncharacterized protein n=1 Tax=Plasmodium vivax India VII TaxID=1077284 RepID=A0A0J9S319_PLAVI|nr:hypothetical protein PVIIG_06559 [Plasmodium vivax India VII]
MCFIIFYQYPFLDKIWNLYEEFNEEIDNLNAEKTNYEGACQAIKQQAPGDKEWYNNLCIKLIRNLGAFSRVMNKDNNKDKYNPERCKNLNSWLYYITKDSTVDQNVIKNIFEHSNNIIGKDNEEHHCINSFYMDIYNKPDDIIMLINLEEYKNDILKILKDNRHDNHCSCLKFIFECANIYREMKNINCIGPSDSSKKSNTCSKLQEFYKFYTSNISTDVELNEKLPSLDAAENKHNLKCPSNRGNQVIKPVHGEKLGSGLGPRQHPQDNFDSTEQSGSTIPLNGTAIVGTMVGIPPFLALIYKVNIIYT